MPQVNESIEITTANGFGFVSDEGTFIIFSYRYLTRL